MSGDILIKGGLVIDGTGSPGYLSDLLIRDGRIASIGACNARAALEIPATGQVVCPGFVDIHTHYDAQLLWDRRLSFSPWHGVTTCVVGNCGFGIAPTRPQDRGIIMRTLEKVEGMSFDALALGLGEWSFETFPEYLNLIDSRPKAINVAVLVGHTPVRVYAMGERALREPADSADLRIMQSLVAEAIEAGAVGFSTSRSPNHVGYRGLPVPSRNAAFSEIRALAEALDGRGLMQITASSEPDFEEFAELTRASRSTLTWTAILTGMAGPESHRRYLARCIELQQSGTPLVPQVACRPLQTEFQFSAPFEFERIPAFRDVAAAEDNEARLKIYRDPDFRRGFREAMAPEGGAMGETARLRPSFHRITIAEVPGRPELQEMPLAEAARQARLNPCDLALDLAIESNLGARFRMPLVNDDEDELQFLLRSPEVVLGLSDAGAHVSQMYDTSYATHLLAHWVRERKALPLEYAIWMLTSRPAEVFGLSDRGRLAVGMPADVVVFDPERVQSGKPERVYDLPGNASRLITRPLGIEAVIVNGTLIRRNGTDVPLDDARFPGRLLRRGSTRLS